MKKTTTFDDWVDGLESGPAKVTGDNFEFSPVPGRQVVA